MPPKSIGQLWCAWCGQITDHRAGSCPDMARILKPCPDCHGSGKYFKCSENLVGSEPCPTCRGTGVKRCRRCGQPATGMPFHTCQKKL